jgi:predicted unusual protein kinase regulating ubiquinone biosynthesis (AarF/ABC1/UbiB family)
VPHVVASAPKVVVQEWMQGVPMAEIIRNGTPEQRDLIGTRLLELTFDTPRRLQMLHGDAHPGNFMLLPDGRMGVIDFGAVAPLPGGLPIELGMTIRLARDQNYDLLLPTMEKAGFIQKGQQISVRDIDQMLRQYVEPIEVEVFHYTRKWLQGMTAIEMDRSVAQIRAARQMDLPPKLVIPMRVIMSVAAILCQLDAHVPIRAISEELVPGFAEPDAAVV